MKEVQRRRSRSELFRQNALDKVVSYFAPVSGAKRMQARAAMALAGGYHSSDRSRRTNKGWGVSDGSADAEILPHLDKLRSDSRDLVRKVPLARGAIKTVVTNVVGTGLWPELQPDRVALKALAGATDAQIDEFIASANRIWYHWAESKFCDASRTQKFSGLQRLVLQSVLESGDVLGIRRYVKRPGYGETLALQVLEADRIDNPPGQTDNDTIAGGVERNALGAPIAYHVLRKHPGDRYQANTRETVRIPALLATGEWAALHIFNRERPQQTRGVPYLAAVTEPLKQLGRYSEAEIDAAVVSAMFTAFVTTEDGSGLASDLAGASPSSSDGSDEIRMGNAAIVDLRKGESIEIANPGRPNTAFDGFVQAVLRQIGVGLELPFEILIKHFTASYSAARAALLEAWKFFKTLRGWLADEFCQPVFEAVITQAVAEGRLVAPGFLADPLVQCAYLQCDWIGPPRGMIDEEKEARANELMKTHGWKTNSEITSELTGGDWYRKQEQRALEEAHLKKFSLAPAGSANAGEQGQQQNNSADNADDGDAEQVDQQEDQQNANDERN